MTPKRILVTGASSGIGEACAVHFARAGHFVAAVARSALKPYADVAPNGGSRLIRRQMDIRDPDSVQQAVNWAATEMGGLDAVVNSAGIAVGGALEDTAVSMIRDQIDTNLLGAIYVTRAAVPHLRQSTRARLIHISSLAGRVALPYQALYCACKFGLEGLCDSLRYELEPHGIAVVLVQPGSVRTALTANRKTVRATASYEVDARAALSANDQDEQRGVDAGDVAAAVGRLLSSTSPPARQRVGHFQECMAVPAQALLPERLFRRITASHFGIGAGLRRRGR